MIGNATAVTQRGWPENGWGQPQKPPYTGSLTSKSCMRATSVPPSSHQPLQPARQSAGDRQFRFEGSLHLFRYRHDRPARHAALRPPRWIALSGEELGRPARLQRVWTSVNDGFRAAISRLRVGGAPFLLLRSCPSIRASQSGVGL